MTSEYNKTYHTKLSCYYILDLLCGTQSTKIEPFSMLEEPKLLFRHVRFELNSNVVKLTELGLTPLGHPNGREEFFCLLALNITMTCYMVDN